MHAVGKRLLILAALLCLSACSTHYTTPGGAVSLAGISESDTDIAEFYKRKPASPFPARMTIVRVQDSGYVSNTNAGYGNGRITVVTTRDIESEQSMDEIQALPFISEVASLNRVLLPANANSLKDIRLAAAKLKSDLLFVYTVDTKFNVEGKSLGPLSLISLGLIPNKKAHVAATVSGVLIDVRTGFIYGATEATAKEEQSATIWSTDTAIDTSRLNAEKEAFKLFIEEFKDLWVDVAEEHATS